MKEILFSVSINDCKIEAITAGGPGGQHQNRSCTAIRITHEPSGAIGFSKDHRSQLQNKRTAFVRLCKTSEMKKYLMVQSAKVLGKKSIEDQVKETFIPKNLKLEYRQGKKYYYAESQITQEDINQLFD
jgi:protein subunit release factor B